MAKNAIGEITFTTTLLQAGKTATGISVPPDAVAKLGMSKKPPVQVTINGYRYRSTVAVMNGKFMVGVSKDVREKAGVNGGDKVDITLSLDTLPREVELPADFVKALSKDVKAKKFFETLSFSNKQRYVLPIGQAKAEDTRARRIAKAVSDLHQEKK